MDGNLIAFSIEEIIVWHFDPSFLDHQADPGISSTHAPTPATSGSKRWTIDSGSPGSAPAIPCAVAHIPRPAELHGGPGSGSLPPHLIFPAKWYLARMHLPLEFDILNGFFSPRLKRVHGVRYRLSKSGQADLSASDGGGAFKLEIVSMFRFPECRTSVEAAQIPGYFLAGMSPPAKYDGDGTYTDETSMFYTTFVYEPPIDGRLATESEEEGYRDVRLSKVYSRSLLNVNSCVSGVSAYRGRLDDDDGGLGSWCVSIVDYPEPN